MSLERARPPCLRRKQWHFHNSFASRVSVAAAGATAASANKHTPPSPPLLARGACIALSARLTRKIRPDAGALEFEWPPLLPQLHFARNPELPLCAPPFCGRSAGQRAVMDEQRLAGAKLILEIRVRPLFNGQWPMADGRRLLVGVSARSPSDGQLVDASTAAAKLPRTAWPSWRPPPFQRVESRPIEFQRWLDRNHFGDLSACALFVGANLKFGETSENWRAVRWAPSSPGKGYV